MYEEEVEKFCWPREHSGPLGLGSLKKSLGIQLNFKSRSN